MDKTVKIQIIRESDNTSFTIGTGSDWLFLKDGLENFGAIENTLSYTDNSIADGGAFTSEHVGSIDRTIKFAYNSIHADLNVQRKKIMDFFIVHDSFKLIVTYGTNSAWAKGKIYKLDVGMTANTSSRLDVMLTFMFANPYWNSIDNFGKNIAALMGMTAFPYLCNPNVGGTTGGYFNFAQQIALYNDGAIDTNCEAIIQCSNGEVINPKITINGEYVRVIDTMADGDEIVMDFTAFPPTVKKNGVNFIGHCDRTSAFDDMVLKRGDNIIEYDADNGSSHMNVTVYYYKQYGAI